MKREHVEAFENVGRVGADIRQELREIKAERAAIHQVLVGGNHLANVLIKNRGADFAKRWPPTMDPQDALRTLCATDDYEVWCCWRAIMLLAAIADPGRPVPPHGSGP